MLEGPDTSARAPDHAIETSHRVYEIDVVDTVPKMVDDTITVRIGCCVVPVFGLENGGDARTIFTFKCVDENCSAFLDM